MSARQSPGLDQLFGYQLQDGGDSHHKHSSRQPTGPPLLDESQSGLLHSFFENPDDINPSFLSLGDEQAFNGDSTAAPGTVYNAHNYNWLFNEAGSQHASPHNTQPLPGQFAGTPHAHTRPGSQDFGSAGHPSNPITPSDDVWAAAQMLHNQNGHQQSHLGPYHDSRPDSMSYNQPHQLTFPAAAHQHPSPHYAYNQQAISNGMYPATFRQQQSMQLGNVHSAQHMQYNHPPSLSRPALQLKFGSDDHFRSENFKPPNKFEPPDLVFRETINHNIKFAENNPLGMNPLSSSNSNNSQEASPVQKRARPPDQNERMQHQKTGDSSEEEVPVTKRRKSQAIKREVVDSPTPRSAPKSAASKSKDAKGKAREAQISASPVTPDATKSRDGAGAAAEARNRSSNSASRNIAGSTPGADDDNKPNRENLSEEQKRANHILSEQKRRNLIKQGFEDLNRMVPELRSGGFSKSNMLVEAAKFMRALHEGNAALKGQLKALDNG